MDDSEFDKKFRGDVKRLTEQITDLKKRVDELLDENIELKQKIDEKDTIIESLIEDNVKFQNRVLQP